MILFFKIFGDLLGEVYDPCSHISILWRIFAPDPHLHRVTIHKLKASNAITEN